MKMTRAALMGGVAMLAIAAGSGFSPAQAQVQMPGWFGSVEGWWYPWTSNGSKFELYDDVPGVNALGIKPGTGPGGRVYAGYRFSNPYDLAVGLQGTWLKNGKQRSAVVESGTGPVIIKQKASYWVGDVEVGYNGTDGGLFGYRLFAGARYAQWKHTVSGHEDSLNEPISSRDKFTGIGPRIGVSGAYRFAPGSNFSIFGDLSGSYLYGHHRASTISDSNSAGNGKSGSGTWNAEGQLGLSYDIAANTSIAVGYRGEYWSSLAFKQMDNRDEFEISGNAHRIEHGPFVRVSYNIGAPRGVPMPMAAPAPVAQSTNAFIIFFDWDRSVLTPQARDTVKQASDQFKAKGNARVTLTGHADRSGSDQYNMALSLRRGAAAKDELVRNGVPANAIVIIGKGESQPLVPTADGVREPQNRRVEIVLQ